MLGRREKAISQPNGQKARMTTISAAAACYQIMTPDGQTADRKGCLDRQEG
jgi:hypothetical protein